MINTEDICRHLDTHMKVMMNQWKVIRRKKGRILTQCVSCKKLEINFFKQVARVNLFGVSGIIMSIFDMGENSSCTPHKSEYFGLKIEINPKKLKRIYEVLKIEWIGMVEYTI